MKLNADQLRSEQAAEAGMDKTRIANFVNSGQEYWKLAFHQVIGDV